MRLLAHRGVWFEKAEQNTLKSFEKAVEAGFGIETDLRDLDGEIVISHDPPRSNSEKQLTLQEFLSIPGISQVPLALNIKSDGILADLDKALRDAGIKDFFVFDMTFPQALDAIRRGLPTFRRISEFEKDYSDDLLWSGAWLDAFESDWWNDKHLRDILANYKKVAVVSPELHGREHRDVWRLLSSMAGLNNLYLCTDYPYEWTGGAA